MSPAVKAWRSKYCWSKEPVSLSLLTPLANLVSFIIAIAVSFVKRFKKLNKENLAARPAAEKTLRFLQSSGGA